MNYYSHHIGDFDRATRHLSRIERSVYLDLIFVYYDTESPLTSDIASLCRKIVARTEEEKSAVLAVLDEFFLETPNGWFHDRCEEELDSYRKSKSQASAAGKASAAARAERRIAALNGNGRSTTVQRPFNDRSTEDQRAYNEHSTNQEPRSNIQEPRSKEKKASPAGDAEMFPNVDPQVITDFKALRKQKRAPITKTAMDKIAAEAAKAGLSLEAALRVCCSRGWQGFEADWVAGKPGSANSNKFRVAHLDHTSSNEAMAASIKRHNITIPADGEIEF